MASKPTPMLAKPMAAVSPCQNSAKLRSGSSGTCFVKFSYLREVRCFGRVDPAFLAWAAQYEEGPKDVNMPKLVPMTQPEFDAFLARAIPQYAEGKTKAGNWLESEALEKAQKEYAELLPQGLQSIDNCLYTLHDKSDAVGLIWMKINPAANRAFICDLYCEERFRGKGYGKMLMLLLEDEAREMGLKSLGLHVFGYNHVARNLYETIGYEITNVNMSKNIG